MINLGINGFNNTIKMIIYNIIKRSNYNINIKVINTIDKTIDDLIEKLQYDNIYKLSKYIILKDIKNNKIIINNKYKIKIINFNNNINWKLYKADYIIDIMKTNNPDIHLKFGAKKVIYLNNFDKDYPLYVFGVNHNKINKNDKIFYYATNTTTSITPFLKILHREYKILEAYITILKKINNYKKVLVLNKKKYLEEIFKILPEMKNIIKDITINIPINIDISLLDFTIKIKKKISYENLKKKIKFYTLNEFAGILKYNSNKKFYYTNLLYDKTLTIFDSNYSMILNNNFLKIICWYNNIIGYSNKILDFIVYLNRI
ncbi:MAG: hypothetical protein NHG14_00650 [Candidatus Shikimatogenerans bostrichidophilus]|nr:MAG: hypothetical protein NHG14_00650 [Candidatus Shikimatogenerans bostrichidophilus]